MRRIARRTLASVIWRGGLLLPLAGGCLSLPAESPLHVPVGSNLRADYVVRAAEQPSAMAAAADGRVFYTEKNTGRIRVIAGGALLADPFATVPVNQAGDRGLLGIALHPAFADNHRVYVFYTRSDTGQNTSDPQAVVDNRVVYFEANGNVAAGGEVFVASLPASQGTTRVSGRIAFAADRTLLVGIGDLTAEASAQDSSVLVGKILRYNDDGSIPADNPVAGSAVYARGLRDVRGLGLDQSGALVAIDTNDHGHSELDRIQAGKNYGWPDVAGVADTTAELAYLANHSDYVDPLLDSGPSGPTLAGISLNPSTRYLQTLKQQMFYGEIDGRRVMSIDLTQSKPKAETFATGFPDPITDLVFTPAGTLYVACTNAIFQISPSN